MTDKACDTCYNPLMRTPRNQEPVKTICVSCDEQSGVGSSSRLELTQSIEINESTISLGSDTHSAEEISTPATDISIELPALVLPPIDTEDIIRRRAQSDQASAEIGRRLLKGWAMLADECPRATCYGIPLVRPPRSRDGVVPKGQVRKLVLYIIVSSLKLFEGVCDLWYQLQS
jgi:uncharacterized Zn finger protein (UPF0148 family)